jgi:TetR/AcrR family transcriptional regulator, transcriptional repressor for nem operon
VRAQGVAKTGVDDIGREAGLTHGAIYRHFASKDALVGAAIEADFQHIVGVLEQFKKDSRGMSAYVDVYLTKDHRDNFSWGCPAAPLASEISRTPAVTQQHFTSGIKKNISAIAALLSDHADEETKETAMVTLATLVGAMAISRATKNQDPEFSAAMLRAAQASLKR